MLSLRFLPFLPLLLLTACDEQQILYTVKSPEPIPPVTGQGGTVVNPHTAPAAGAELPVPDAIRYAAAFAEPVETLALRGVELQVPKRWRARASESAMRIAQYDVAGAAAGMESGEFTVFHFGPDQGGSVQANATRWISQFTADPGERTPLALFGQGKVGDATVTRLALKGTWAQPSMVPGSAAPPPRGEFGMDALIVEGGPQGPLFLRLTGPFPLVAGEDKVIEAMAATIKFTNAPDTAQPKPTPAPTPVQVAAPHVHTPGDGHDHSQDAAPADGLAKVEAPGIAFAIPARWEAQQTASSMRALQFRLPGEGTEDAGEFVVFYFGPEGGGTAEDNLKRWLGQVRQPDGKPSNDVAQTAKLEQKGLTLTRLIVSGTYAPTAMGPMAPPPTPKPDQMLVGVVVEGGKQGPLYLRVTGPKTLLARESQLIESMILSIAPN